MRILERGRKTPVQVYGVYWYEGERICWVIPYHGYEGFITVSEKDCDLIDSQLSACFILRKNDAGGDFLLHWAADKDDLIYDLIDHDPDAMQEFMCRLSVGKSPSSE